MLKCFFSTLLVTVSLLVFVSCDRDTPAERAGEAIEDATDNASDAVEDMGDKVKDATDE